MQSLRFIHFTAFVFFLATLSSASQDILVKALSVEDGLSQSSVNSITQDYLGITWISTGDGLNSYDGSSFKTYYSIGGIKNNNVLSNNSIRRVLADSAGNLWAGCDQGMLLFDRLTNTLSPCFDTISLLSNQSCLPLFLSADTLYVLASRKGIIAIDLNLQIATVKFDCQSLSHLNLSITNDREIWFGSFPNRINRILYHDKHLSVDTFSLPAPHLGMVCQVVQGRLNEYLVIGANQLYILNTDNKQITPLLTQINVREKNQSSYKTAVRDKQNKIWVASEDGRMLILNTNFEFERQIRLIKHLEDPSSIFSALMCLYQDTFGNIWAGSDGQGIAIFRPEQLDFNPVRRIKCDKQSIEKPFVRAFEQDSKGRTWIGTYNEGILLRESPDRHCIQIKPQLNSTFPSHNDIYTMQYFKEDEMLIGTSAGLISINPENLRTQIILGSNDPDLVLKVHQIELLNSHSILALINKYLKKLDKKDQLWIEDPDFHPVNLHFDYIYVHKDTIFAFSTIGFMVYNSGKSQKLDYRYNEKSISLDVNSAHYDSLKQAFWLCTENGLILMNKDGAILRWYSTLDGLANHYLYGLLPDKFNNLWIASNGGICRFDIENEQFENFGYLDGLQSLEFNTGAFYSSKSGEFYFGGINGFNHFYPDSIKNKAKSTRIILKRILVNDEEFSCKPNDLCKNELHLAHFQNTLTFEFQGLDYLNNSGIKYTYYLENWDQEWVSAGRNTQVRYSKLKPGAYVFMVKDARFPDGDSSILKIHFKIDKPYWRELWFQIPVFILLISFSLLIFRWISTISMRRKIAQLEEQRRINTIRSRIASDLHDDIGAGLSKLAMISEAASLEKQKNTKDDLQTITTRTRQMIDQLRMIVWTLDPPDESLDELISFLRAKTGELMDQLEIHYHFDAPESTEIKQVSPEFRRNVYYAVREALHNALKHSQCRRIDLKISIDESFLHIWIIDDGIGFRRENLSKHGYGLKGMEKRITEIKGGITIKSEQDKGTQIHFSVPLEITT